MATPRAVSEARAKAEEIHRQTYGGDTDTLDKEAAPPTEGSPEPQPQPPHPQPAPPPPEQTPMPDMPSVQDGNEFEHKYKSLRGKYDAEVPMLQQRLREAEQRMAGMEALIARMAETSEPTKPAAKESNEDIDLRTLIKEDERNEYGEELIDLIGRRAMQQVLPYVRKLEQELRDLKGQLGQVRGSVAEVQTRTIFDVMDEKLPEWRKQNNDPEFLAWLQEPDPFSGAQRQMLLNEAFQAGNAARVLAFFTAYRNEQTVVTPSAQPPSHTSSVGAATPPNGAGKVPLETLAAPGRGKPGATASAQAGERFFTHKEVTEFYRDVTRGAYRGRDAERFQMERDIIAAANAGRIR